MNGLHGSVDDPLPGFVGFAHALRHAGTPGDQHRVQTFLTALDHCDVSNPTQVYWAGRMSLCSEPDDLVKYDALFAVWFGNETIPAAASSAARPTHTRLAALNGRESGDSDARLDDQPLGVAASDIEVLRHRDFSELSAAERAHLRALLAQLDSRPPMRVALRRRPWRRGALDPGRTLRGMLRSGGEPVRLLRRRRTTRPRRVVLLIDISGSMSPYADGLLRFAHIMLRGSPFSTEVFTLGTRLTRLTRALRQRDQDRALAQAGRAVPDYSGGTRLGETLRAFLDRWGQGGVARRAVVVVCSDGWERGDPALLAEQTARLRRLAHAVLWVNPHAGKDGYVPTQGGIRAALPNIDRLLAGHSLATLQQLVTEVRRA